jgi:hypothetical protein
MRASGNRPLPDGSGGVCDERRLRPARSLPALNGTFPVPQTTFVAPGAPRLSWIGTRIAL